MKCKIAWLALSALVAIALVMTFTETTTTAATIPKTTTAPVTKTNAAAAEKPQYGGTIKMYNYMNVGSWDPADSVGSSAFAFSFIYEQLGFGDWAKGLGGTGESTYMVAGIFPWQKTAKGGLAESWKWMDPLTLVFQIRHGVKFQNKPPANGREMTAEDVAFCLNRFVASPGAWMNSKAYIDSINATDKYTVVLKLKKPFAFMMMDFVFSIPGLTYPPEVIQQYGKLTDWKLACGTGPWVLDSFTPDSVISLKRNPDYWGYDELNPGNKLPYADGVDILYISDPAARLAALRTGKLDTLWSVGDSDAKLLQQTNPELQKKKVLASKGDVTLWMRCDIPPFNDVRVRQAMSMAIDYNKIAKDYLGEGEVLCFPIRPDHELYTPLNKQPQDIRDLFGYKPEKAGQLLDAAGFRKDTTGIRFKAQIDSSSDFNTAVSILIKYWADIGVDCTIKPATSRAALDAMRSRKAYPGMVAYNNTTMDVWRMLLREQTGNSGNYSAYSNPEYDQKVTSLVATFDIGDQNKKMRDLSADNIRLVDRIEFPIPIAYNYWQPWLKGYHGEVSLGGTQVQGPIFARTWVDQNLKKK